MKACPNFSGSSCWYCRFNSNFLQNQNTHKTHIRKACCICNTYMLTCISANIFSHSHDHQFQHHFWSKVYNYLAMLLTMWLDIYYFCQGVCDQVLIYSLLFLTHACCIIPPCYRTELRQHHHGDLWRRFHCLLHYRPSNIQSKEFDSPIQLLQKLCTKYYTASFLWFNHHSYEC